MKNLDSAREFHVPMDIDATYEEFKDAQVESLLAAQLAEDIFDICKLFENVTL